MLYQPRHVRKLEREVGVLKMNSRFRKTFGGHIRVVYDGLDVGWISGVVVPRASGTWGVKAVEADGKHELRSAAIPKANRAGVDRGYGGAREPRQCKPLHFWLTGKKSQTLRLEAPRGQHASATGASAAQACGVTGPKAAPPQAIPKAGWGFRSGHRVSGSMSVLPHTCNQCWKGI